MRKFHYFAFISYQHQDEKWANWLQRKLENYKLPVSDNNSKTSKYIRPVFRDKTDLLPSPLTPALKEALRESKYLIVICSPNATKSAYVNDEINYYIDLGRKDYIIPFIIDGKPYSENNELECFPDALRLLPKEDELNGCNIQESGKEHAFIATVARMLNLKFDTLWDRFKRQERKIRSLILSIIALFAFLSLGLYEYNRTKVEYYADYVDLFAIPRGVIPLTSNQVDKRNYSYRFKYKRVPFGETNALEWRLVSVEHINSKRHPIDHIENIKRSSIIKLEYYPNSNEVSHTIFCNRNGRVLYRHQYTSPDSSNLSSIIDVKKSVEPRGDGYAGADALISQVDQEQFSNITRYVLERDCGYITKITFHHGNNHDTENTLTSDANGISGIKFKLDSLGRCIEETFIDRKGLIKDDKQGICKVKYKYDKWGNISVLSYWNKNDNLVPCSKGWAIKVSESDKNGNIITVSLYDEKSNPCIDKSYNYSFFTQEYDGNGNMISQDFFNEKGTPILIRGYYHKVVCEYDKNGYISKMSYYGLDGKLINIDKDYAVATVRCDSHGNKVEMTFFAFINDSIHISPRHDNIAILKQKFDNQGNLIRQECYDRFSKPCMCERDYSILINKYNEDGKRIEGQYLDTLGNPHISDYYKYSIIRLEYDYKGNWISSSYFNDKNEPTLNRNKIARLVNKYNDCGLLIEETVFDDKGKPCMFDDAYSRRLIIYNGFGKKVDEKRFDQKGIDITDDPTYQIYYWVSNLKKHD